MTLTPSSVSSPVNYRGTPPRREPDCACARMQAFSSLMMVPKWRVFNPLEDVSVLQDRCPSVSGQVRQAMRHVLSVHRIAHPYNRMSSFLHGSDVPGEVLLDLWRGTMGTDGDDEHS